MPARPPTAKTALIGAPTLADLLHDRIDSPSGHEPGYRRLADGIRLLIADGRLLHGTRLPAERKLGAALSLIRTTISAAYNELRDRGFLVTRRGAGSVAVLPGGPQPAAPSLLRPSPGDGDWIDFTTAAPSAPAGLLEAYARALDDLPAHLGGSGYHPQGIPALREAIAERYRVRGLPTGSDQIIVTTGALAGLALPIRTLLGPGERVAVESPSYPNAVATARQSGARLVPVPCDDTGTAPATVEAVVRQSSPHVALLIPDFHNPTGTLMPDADRARVARTLADQCVVAVVDETLVELRLDVAARDMPLPFAAHSPDTITVGGASKSFWGGLRVGWIRVPPAQIGRFAGTRLSLDLGAALLEQLVLDRLLRAPGPVVPTDRLASLRASRDTLLEAIGRHLPGWSVRVPAGGLSLWCALPVPASTSLALCAERLGLAVPTGAVFAVNGIGLEDRVRLPITRPAGDTDAVVARLARAWHEALGSRGTGSRAPVVG